MTKEENMDLCKTCKNYWKDFPLPLDKVVYHCDVIDEKFCGSKEMDDIVPYPCTKCPFDCYIKK